MALALYFDDDCADRGVIRGLRQRGVDLLTSDEAGNRGSHDEVQLAFALQHQRVVVTANRVDFLRLGIAELRAGRSHEGIIVIDQQRWDVGEQIRRLLRVVTARAEHGMRDSVEFLSRWGDEGEP